VLALGRLINIALLPFLPFGMVLGFLGYGFISGQSFAKESFVYAGYVGVFSDTYMLLTSFVRRLPRLAEGGHAHCRIDRTRR
jgi:hypothetical protein